MTPDRSAAHCVGLVKDRAPARYVSALFAPAAVRRSLLALYALASELKHIRHAAHEPLIVTMRFQWWADALGALPGNPRGHPVLQEIALAIMSGALTTPPLFELVEAEERNDAPAAAEIMVVTLAARICGAPPGPNPLALAAGEAIATGSRDSLARARAIWRREKRARRSELPAYLPATFVDARHPVTELKLRWRVLTRGLSNRF